MTIEDLKNKFDKLLTPMKGEEFNVFHWIRLRNHEVFHSSLIKVLLNYKGTHGFKGEFLRLFLEGIDSDLVRNLDFPVENSFAETEHAAPVPQKSGQDVKQGRIDIYVEGKTNNIKKAIIIENKLDAKDQPSQLARYDEWAKGKGKMNDGDYVIIYLTLDGKKATKGSCGKIEYVRISYQKTIIPWLNACIRRIDELGKDESHMRLRMGIKQYREYLERRVLKEIELKELIKNNLELTRDLLESDVEISDRDVVYQLYNDQKCKTD